MAKDRTPISATGTRSRPTSHRSLKGFTLIELLVVIVIIAIMVSMVTLSVSILGRDDQLTTETQRLERLIVAAREQAEIQARDYGLSFHPEGYQFLRFDVRRGIWAGLEGNGMFRARPLPPGVTPRLTLEGREVVLDSPEEGRMRTAEDEAQDDEDALDNPPPPPQVIIFANGDLSPFELKLERDGTQNHASLLADATGRLMVVTADEDVEDKRRREAEEQATAEAQRS